MTAFYRKYEIQITVERTKAYFIVSYPNGAKMTDGFFSTKDSLSAKYQELKNRIDMELKI